MTRSKTPLLVMIGLLLLLVPTGVGLVLLRTGSDTRNTEPSYLPTPTQMIREEVINSVLSRSAAVTSNTPRILLHTDENRLVSLQNGSAIPLDDDFHMTLSLDPYPPSITPLFVTFYVTDDAGEPVENAEITLRYDMPAMKHGLMNVEIIPLGKGYYQGQLKLTMFGTWTFNTSVKIDRQAKAFTHDFDLNVWPE